MRDHVNAVGLGEEWAHRWSHFDRDSFSEIIPEQGGIVVALLGAAPRDGTTTVAFNTALALSAHTTLRIGLLDLNLKNPEMSLWMRSEKRSCSALTLRARLQMGTMNERVLWNGCVPYKNREKLRVFPGTHRRDTAGDVTPAMVQSLLCIARKTFDITIIDAASYPDTAATVGAVQGADVRLLVSQQTMRSYMWSVGEWFACYWQPLGVSLSSMYLVLNRVNRLEEPPERIAALLGVSLLESVPNVAYPYVVQSYKKQVHFYEQALCSFQNSMNTIASFLLAQMGLPALKQQIYEKKHRSVAYLPRSV